MGLRGSLFKNKSRGGSPFIRALTGNQNLLLVDGIRMNNSTYRYGPNQYLNTIDVYSIESLDIVRGTGSVQYGSDAMGGVIQIMSKSSTFSNKPQWHLNLFGKLVSADMEYTGRSELNYQSENFSLHAGYSNRKFGNLVGGDSTGQQNPSGYSEQGYDIKAKWKWKYQSILTIASQELTQKDVPLYHRVKLENFAYYLFSPQNINSTMHK